ncbi:BrnT family toxin [Candidatus Albibeggiatoa sp. nov. BB20]|uniref:BrnT family toxin n=1 Tax=Candidatus Albibeggiatoa sp. nov. BB20 TaxID=3162723 RepID=UPI00336570BF
MKFEWNRRKEQINIKKHGVSFSQASSIFSDPYALSQYDDEHSHDEDRWALLGKASNEVILIVVHTMKDANGLEIVRIISARKATKKEIQMYQKRCFK